jgi:hypothetical protein
MIGTWGRADVKELLTDTLVRILPSLIDHLPSGSLDGCSFGDKHEDGIGLSRLGRRDYVRDWVEEVS